MADSSDLMEWRFFFLSILRSVGVCVFAFVSLNATVFLRASIQVHVDSAPKRAPSIVRSRSDGAISRTSDGNHIPHSDRGRNSPRPLPAEPTPKRPRSFGYGDIGKSKKQQQKASCTSIMNIYEEIMASDAETIQVQQATIQSQQEIIHSQKGMILQLMQLVEESGLFPDGNPEESAV